MTSQNGPKNARSGRENTPKSGRIETIGPASPLPRPLTRLCPAHDRKNGSKSQIKEDRSRRTGDKTSQVGPRKTLKTTRIGPRFERHRSIETIALPRPLPRPLTRLLLRPRPRRTDKDGLDRDENQVRTGREKLKKRVRTGRENTPKSGASRRSAPATPH